MKGKRWEAEKAFRPNSQMKLLLLLMSLLSLSPILLLTITITSTLQLDKLLLSKSIRPPENPTQTVASAPAFDFLMRELKEKEIKIGIVNMHGEEVEEWKGLGSTSMVHFNRVPKDRRWEDYFPEWIDEDQKWGAPKCPDIPMPIYQDYSKFNILIAKVPCQKRDVFRLQVNLVVANLAVNNAADEQNLLVVFIGQCEPMMEIFRCDDLVRHEGEYWIYRPDLRRLKRKTVMPVGTCQLAAVHENHDEGKVSYDFSTLSNPIHHFKEAYVTILHSSEAYVCGAIVLAQSIILTNSTKDLVLLADQTISKKSRQALRAAGWKVQQIERIRNPHAKKDAYNEWNYSKLRIWQLTEYDKIIFIDSDVIVLQNIDKFFAYPQLSAVGNDKVLFNSGIMLIEPSDHVFKMLMEKRYTLVSYNGGDQGYLNEAFTWWHRWPTKLNFLKIFEGPKDAQHKVPESVYAIHYLGLKPWMCYRDYDCNWDIVNHWIFASDTAHWKWWRVYDAMSKRLRPFCGLSKSMDARIRKWRRMADNSSLPDRHWMIKVKDPRQHSLKRRHLL